MNEVARGLDLYLGTRGCGNIVDIGIGNAFVMSSK